MLKYTFIEKSENKKSSKIIDKPARKYSSDVMFE